MNISLCIENINSLGGTERAALNMAEIFLDEGHSVTIFSIIENSDVAFYEIDERIKIENLKFQKIPSNLLGKIKWYSNHVSLLKKRFNSSNFDRVFTLGHNISFLFSFLKCNINTIACEHIDSNSISFLFRKILNLRYRRLAALVLLSENAKINWKDANSNIYIIPNYIKSQSNPIPINRISRKDSFIYAGRLSKEKGIDQIPIFGEYLMKNNINWMINIYGEGAMKYELMDEIKLRNLNNLHLFQPVQDIHNKFLENKILLLFSYTEAFPMVILEANSYGLPVLALKNSGTSQLVKNGENGFLVNNIEDLIERAKFLIENPEELNRMSLKSLEFSSRFSKQQVKPKWMDLLIGGEKNHG